VHGREEEREGKAGEKRAVEERKGDPVCIFKFSLE